MFNVGAGESRSFTIVQGTTFSVGFEQVSGLLLTRPRVGPAEKH